MSKSVFIPFRVEPATARILESLSRTYDSRSECLRILIRNEAQRKGITDAGKNDKKVHHAKRTPA